MTERPFRLEPGFSGHDFTLTRHPQEKKKHGQEQHNAWETIQRSHAIANGCYVTVANRIGLEQPVGGDGLEFWGQSFVAGTSGQILGKAGGGPG